MNNQQKALKPINFNGEMVRAILDGRKTQTRRIMKPQPLWEEEPGRDQEGNWCGRYQFLRGNPENPDIGVEVDIHKPRYLPGDILYVRETWAQIWKNGEYCLNDGNPKCPCGGCVPEYKADTGNAYPGEWPTEEARGNPDAPKWRPSFHMPRWAARIFLEVTAVRVERLQEISEADARAEGVAPLFDAETQSLRPECRTDDFLNYLWHGNHGQYGCGNKKSAAWPYQYSGYKKARDSFSSLWEMLNGSGSWEKNFWVWVYEFKLRKDNHA